MNSEDGIILYSCKNVKELKLDLNEERNGQQNIEIDIINDAMMKIFKSNFDEFDNQILSHDFLDIALIEILVHDSSLNLQNDRNSHEES